MALIRVRYRGIADTRIISVDDMARAGLHVDKDLVWDRQNLFSLTMEGSERLEELLREQGHFDISALDDAGRDKVISVGDNHTNEGNVLVDGNTGASTEAKGGGA